MNPILQKILLAKKEKEEQAKLIPPLTPLKVEIPRPQPIEEMTFDAHPQDDIEAVKSRIKYLESLIEKKTGDKQHFKQVLENLLLSMKSDPNLVDLLHPQDMNIMVRAFQRIRDNALVNINTRKISQEKKKADIAEYDKMFNDF